jgi:hypothetical protein
MKKVSPAGQAFRDIVAAMITQQSEPAKGTGHGREVG